MLLSNDTGLAENYHFMEQKTNSVTKELAVKVGEQTVVFEAKQAPINYVDLTIGLVLTLCGVIILALFVAVRYLYAAKKRREREVISNYELVVVNESTGRRASDY